MKKLIMTFCSILLISTMLLTFPHLALASDSAPIAENLELKTYCKVSTSGMLSAFDPDGGSVRFQITTQPVKGALSLSEDGAFTYTPQANKKGLDYFGYRAIDDEGKQSQEATVIIRIMRQKKEIRYADLQGNGLEYPAVVLSELGLFTGRQICGTYCFEPGETVTRGEFLSMCMKLIGKPRYLGVWKTGYQDDEKIPSWQKVYASTAAMHGIYQGFAENEGTRFDGDEILSYAQAAAYLERVLQLRNVSFLPGYERLDLRLTQACFREKETELSGEVGRSEQPLTRADVALMLSAAAAYLEN